jgi:CubicO group peptidase (beta-lactamase class C family)
MKKILSSVFFMLFFSILSTTYLFCCKEKPSLTALENYIKLKLEHDKTPGLSACIIKEDRIVWSKGFGFQNLDKKIPMTVHSIMDVASISKLITAMAILKLAEQKHLDITNPINKFLPFRIQHPEYPEVEITISQLLSHSSSISNGPSLWRSYSCGSQPLTLAEWVKAYFLPQGQYYHREGNFARWKPGEGFLYSNAGYTLLSYLVEILSGESFTTFCKKNILEPLEMKYSSFNISEVPKQNLVTMYSYGYNSDLERDLIQPGTDLSKIISGDYFFPLCNYTTPMIGAGGLYSDAEELSNLLIALMNQGVFNAKSILSKESMAKMLSPYIQQSLLPEQFAAYGLGGYALKLNNGEPVWGHTGADPGISTFMLFNPEMKIGAIVLANRFVDIRDLIEWLFAEGINQYGVQPLVKNWRQYAGNQKLYKVVFRVLPYYLPGDSRIYLIGNHRYLGRWASPGVPLIPQKDRYWEKTFQFPNSTRLEFKITRGDWNKQAVTSEGKELPNNFIEIVKDTVCTVMVEDWKDQAQQ